jgi:hypothetical protein
MSDKRKGEVEIRKDDLVGYCLPESVEIMVHLGWTVVDDGSSEGNVEIPVSSPETNADGESRLWDEDKE